MLILNKDERTVFLMFYFLFLQTMHAHSQFCLSGDTTLQATKYAIESLAKEEADERFVIILSDANFDRYGISPAKFGQILRSDEQVNAYAIFIGSLGDQAIRFVLCCFLVMFIMEKVMLLMDFSKQFLQKATFFINT